MYSTGGCPSLRILKGFPIQQSLSKHLLYTVEYVQTSEKFFVETLPMADHIISAEVGCREVLKGETSDEISNSY